jgi:hypothetical protein
MTQKNRPGSGGFFVAGKLEDLSAFDSETT